MMIFICFIIKQFGAPLTLPHMIKQNVFMLIIGKIIEESLTYTIMSLLPVVIGKPQNIY